MTLGDNERRSATTRVVRRFVDAVTLEVGVDDDQLREPVVVYVWNDYQPPRLSTVRRVLEPGTHVK